MPASCVADTRLRYDLKYLQHAASNIHNIYTVDLYDADVVVRAATRGRSVEQLTASTPQALRAHRRSPDGGNDLHRTHVCSRYPSVASQVRVFRLKHAVLRDFLNVHGAAWGLSWGLR